MNQQQKYLISELERGLRHANELLQTADCEPQFRPSQAFGSLRYTVQRLLRELRIEARQTKCSVCGEPCSEIAVDGECVHDDCDESNETFSLDDYALPAALPDPMRNVGMPLDDEEAYDFGEAASRG